MEGGIPRTVVVMDDDPVLCHLIEARLTEAGYEVLTVVQPETLLETMAVRKPRVLLLDLMMPRVHGFTLLQQIRQNPALAGLHVIVTSSKRYPADIQKAKDLGASDYFTKPVDFEDLLKRLDAVFNPSAETVFVRFWGTRGSIATPGAGTLRYGGNTSCVEIRAGGEVFIIDCGTGARELGESIEKEFKKKSIECHMFISHSHWDHIQGFPFFAPAYAAGNRLTIYSVRGADKSLRKVFTGQMDSSYFPISLNDLHAHLDFVEMDGPMHIGATRISPVYLNHPGIALGFRFDFGSKSVSYISDHEPYCRIGEPDEHHEKLDRQLDEFVRGSDLYIREAQFTEREYLSRNGWGHGTWTDAVNSAHAAGVKRLVLFHHDPSHDDAAIDEILSASRQYMAERQMKFECFAAAERSEIRL